MYTMDDKINILDNKTPRNQVRREALFGLGEQSKQDKNVLYNERRGVNSKNIVG